MSEPVPSKECLNFSWSWDADARNWRISMVEMGDGLLAGYDHLAGYYERRLIEEIHRLRTALTGVSTCGTCEACRGAARLALGGVTPEPPCGPGDTGYTEMLERIRDEVGVEIFDMQHPHTWFRAARAAQPPGDG